MLTRAKISSCFYKKKEFEERSVAADFLRGQRCRRSARLSIQLLNEGHVSGFGLNPEILLGAHLERQTVSYGIALGIAAIEDIDLGSCMGIIEQKNEVRRTKHHNSSIRPYKHTSIRNEETEKCDMFCFCTTTFSVMVSWIKKKNKTLRKTGPPRYHVEKINVNLTFVTRLRKIFCHVRNIPCHNSYAVISARFGTLYCIGKKAQSSYRLPCPQRC